MARQRPRPSAVIIDVDGTLAIITDRSPYSARGVLKDKPNAPVIAVAAALAAAGNVKIVVSGRNEEARADTEKWLAHHLPFAFVGPYMRPAGDSRNDAVLKREVYDREIKPKFHVVCVLDDRDQVVRMWRSLGLTCLQVAPGDF